MAIEFVHRNKKYRADTPREAAELRLYLDKQDSSEGVHGEQPRFWTADSAMDVLDGIGESQKKFLAILADGASVQSTTLVEGIGLHSEIALAGVVSGLSKQFRKMAVSPHDVYRVQVEWKGKGKVRYFRLLPDFRDALVELGWPDAWEGKEKAK